MINVKDYKVGDKVRIISHFGFNTGDIATIKSIIPSGDGIVFILDGSLTYPNGAYATVRNTDETSYDWELIKGKKEKKMKVGSIEFDKMFNGKFQGREVKNCIIKKHDGYIVLCSDEARVGGMDSYVKELGYKHTHALRKIKNDADWESMFSDVVYVVPAKRSHKKKTIGIGDTVQILEVTDNFPPDRVGCTGVVKCIENYGVHRLGIEFPLEVKGGHNLDGICGTKDGYGYFFESKKVKLATSKATKTSPVAPELVEDPRTFYKVLRIDGSPANNMARATGFKYSLPVDGPAEWTPTIKNLYMCDKGYHIIEAKDIKYWLTAEYYNIDTIVCECKARGEIKEGSNKYVAQSIKLTKILYRWNDASILYTQAIEKISSSKNGARDKARKSYDALTAKINAEQKAEEKKLIDTFFTSGRA